MLAGLGGALSAGALVAGLKNAGEQVVQLAHDADKLSTSTEELSRLRFAAQQTGVDAETLSHAMLKLQETVGKAAVEGGEAAQKIQALGLNVKQLAGESPDQQFKQIASAIASIQNPSQRAAAEVALFGKSGAELKPLLEQGASGLAAMSAEADKLGITISSVDAESTLRASRAVDKISEAISGVGQHIAAGLAPYVEDVANRIIAWAETGQRMQKIVSGSLQAVAYGAAFVADVFKLGKAAIEFMGSGGALALAGLIGAVDVLGKAASWVLEKVFGKKIDTSGLDAATKDLFDKSQALAQAAGKDVSDVFTGRTAASVFEYFDNVNQKADQTSREAVKAHEALGHAFSVPADNTDNLKKVTDALAELHKQVDEFGLSEGAKKLAELKLLGATDAQLKEGQQLADTLDKLKQQADITKQLTELQKQARQAGLDEAGKKVDDLKALGASSAQINEAKRLQQQIEATTQAKEEAKQLDEEAKRAKEDALTPLQKEQAELAKLQKLYETGRITAAEYASAAAKKEAELHGEEHHTQQAATRGSEEGFKLLNEINNRAGKGDKKEQIAQQQLRAQEKANQLLEKLLGHTAPKPSKQLKLGAA